MIIFINHHHGQPSSGQVHRVKRLLAGVQEEGKVSEKSSTFIIHFIMPVHRAYTVV